MSLGATLNFYGNIVKWVGEVFVVVLKHYAGAITWITTYWNWWNLWREKYIKKYIYLAIFAFKVWLVNDNGSGLGWGLGHKEDVLLSFTEAFWLIDAKAISTPISSVLVWRYFSPFLNYVDIKTHANVMYN